jgi:drug/metabolite transporter (DMT)-like permease
VTASTEHRTTALAFGAGLTACLIWAVCNVINKALLDAGVAPLTLLAGQLLVSTPALWIVAFAAGRRPKLSIVVRLMPLGVLQPGLAYGLSIIGLTMTSATIEALLFSTETLFIIALAWPLLGEKPSRVTIMAGIAGSLGVGLVSVGGSALQATYAGILGPALILTGVFAAALYSVRLRREAVSIDALSLIASCQTGGLISVLLGWLLWPEHDRMALLTLHTIPLIALSGIMMHAVAFVLFAVQLQRMRAGTASLVLLTTPVMTGVLAYLWLGERLNPVQMLGAVVVMFSLLAVSWVTVEMPVSTMTSRGLSD